MEVEQLKRQLSVKESKLSVPVQQAPVSHPPTNPSNPTPSSTVPLSPTSSAACPTIHDYDLMLAVCASTERVTRRAMMADQLERHLNDKENELKKANEELKKANEELKKIKIVMNEMKVELQRAKEENQALMTKTETQNRTAQRELLEMESYFKEGIQNLFEISGGRSLVQSSEDRCALEATNAEGVGPSSPSTSSDISAVSTRSQSTSALGAKRRTDVSEVRRSKRRRKN